MSIFSEYAETTGVCFNGGGITAEERQRALDERRGAGATPTPPPALSADEWNALGALVAGGALTVAEAQAYAASRGGQAGRLNAEVSAAQAAKGTTVQGRQVAAVRANPQAAREGFYSATGAAPGGATATPTPQPTGFGSALAAGQAFAEPIIGRVPQFAPGAGESARATATAAPGGGFPQPTMATEPPPTEAEIGRAHV